MKKVFKNIGIIELIIYVILFIYGILALYSLYVILPEGLKGLFPAAMFLGGFLVPFYAPIIYGEIKSKDKNSKYYLTVLLAIYAIPILLMGTYHIKLNMLEKADYRFKNDEIIKYKYTIDYKVDDSGDSDSLWNFTLRDANSDERFKSGEVYEVNKFDVASYILDINCSSHAITDPDNPGANLNGTTVQRRVGFFAGNNFVKGQDSEGTIVLNDKDGNAITVDIKISFERKLSVWDVLKAKIVSESDGLDIFDNIFSKCPNAFAYTSQYEMEEEIDTDVFLVSDEEEKLVYFSELLGKDVMIEMDISDDGIYESIGTTTYPAMQVTEADGYFDLLMQKLKEKYGEDEDSDYYVESYLWLHEIDDKAIILTKDDFDDGFTVSCYVTKRYEESDKGKSDDEELDESQIEKDTWGALKESNSGELKYDTLSEDEQKLVNYPILNEEEVFWTPNGKSYHSVDWCYTLENSKTILSGTLDEAIKAGKSDPCSKCVGD